jgi:hypothetical protein
MASPFAFAWMLLKDSARVAPPNPQYPQEDDGRDEPRRQFEQLQHPEMPLPDEGPSLGEMADMSPEEAEFERALMARRNAPKPEDPAQTTLHDFD